MFSHAMIPALESLVSSADQLKKKTANQPIFKSAPSHIPKNPVIQNKNIPTEQKRNNSFI